MEKTLKLDFACCGCEEPINVTLQCSGKPAGILPPAAGETGSAVMQVQIPCPTCGLVNQLLFEPSGTVRTVQPYRCLRPLPEPSLN